MIFNKIPADTFESLITSVGMLLRKFDPTTAADPPESDVICATTGGINASCVPTYSDLGEDVDNCPNNMMELKQLESWDCKLSTNSITASPEIIAKALGAADIDQTSGKITPRMSLKLTDFKEVWWVGPTSGGGCVAIHLINGLSTSGLSLQTQKNTKAQFPIEIVGHVSLEAQDVVPMEFYFAKGTTEEATPTPGET